MVSTSAARACRICLKITRLATCSPTATLAGAAAARILARPRISSGLVGSSTQYGSQGASAVTAAVAWAIPHRWLASTAILTPGPTASRARAMRRMSSAMSAPTLSLIWVNPSATAWRDSSMSFSSE